MSRYFAVLILTSFFVSAAIAQPKIEIVEGAEFSFGEIFRGDKVNKKLTVKNAGDQELIIERVHAPCGCTATLLGDKNVPPGGTTSLSVGFDSKNFSGTVHKDAYVQSNDPTTPSLRIRFSAKILQALEASPAYFYFQEGRVDSTMTTKVKLRNVTDQPIKILEVKTAVPQTKLNVPKKNLKAGEETEITLTFTPSRVGYVNQDVIVKTSHPKQPELALKLMCNVLSTK